MSSILVASKSIVMSEVAHERIGVTTACASCGLGERQLNLVETNIRCVQV